MDRFRSFLDSLYDVPGSRVGVLQLREAFLQTLSERERLVWPRWRFVADLQAAGLVIGIDASSRVQHVANVSLEPPARWQPDESGRLRLIKS